MIQHFRQLLVMIVALGTCSGYAFDAHEWLVSVHDPSLADQHRVYLPRFIQTRRPRAIGDGPPPPHGGILLEGAPPKILDVVIKLPAKTAIASTWPQAKSRDGQLAWTALAPTTQPLRPGNSWWDALRSESQGVGRDGQYDNILFFDPILNLTNIFNLEVKDTALTVAMAKTDGPTPVQIIVLTRQADKWASATAKIGEAASPKDLAPLADSLAPVLKSASPKLQAHLTQIIKHALTGATHAAVVQLPDTLITSEILPLPDNHSRTRLALFVWREVRSDKDWKKLVEQLGHADWTMRETATQELSEAGKTALPSLIAAAKSKNLETRLRVERLLMRLGKDPDKLKETPTPKKKKSATQQINIRLGGQ